MITQCRQKYLETRDRPKERTRMSALRLRGSRPVSKSERTWKLSSNRQICSPDCSRQVSQSQSNLVKVESSSRHRKESDSFAIISLRPLYHYPAKSPQPAQILPSPSHPHPHPRFVVLVAASAALCSFAANACAPPPSRGSASYSSAPDSPAQAASLCESAFLGCHHFCQFRWRHAALAVSRRAGRPENARRPAPVHNMLGFPI